MLGQLRTCSNLMTTRYSSCFSTQRELSISIPYLFQSPSAMPKFHSNNLRRIFCSTLGCHLTMNAHVANIARTCYIELCRLTFIHGLLTSIATATLVSEFALSTIGYCNSLLFGSTHDLTSHFQRMLNHAARVILCLPMSFNITTHLKSFHWLPVKVRSTYKMACLCYHCHSNTAPSYVADMLHRKPPHIRNTRSSS